MILKQITFENRYENSKFPFNLPFVNEGVHLKFDSSLTLFVSKEGL